MLKFVFLCIFALILAVKSDDEFSYFGIINSPFQWNFHCRENFSKILEPPNNDQPLIVYECPFPSFPIEISPIEIDLTFFCRSTSRLVWLIIDFYQFPIENLTIRPEKFDFEIKLNEKIFVNQSKTDVERFQHRSIFINAFYIPFEFLQSILDENIEISIKIKNQNQLNRCEFLLDDRSTWKHFLDEQCPSNQSKTLVLRHGICHFFSNRFDENLKFDQLFIFCFCFRTKTIERPRSNDVNISLPVNENINFEFLTEENYRLALAILAQTHFNSDRLKLIFIFILLIFVVFLLYIVSFHFYLRRRANFLRSNSLLS